MAGNDVRIGLLDLIWPLAERVGWLRRAINGIIIDSAATRTRARPLPYSMWGPHDGPPQAPSGGYVAWPGLTDRGFTGRHLPPAPADEVDRLPPVAALMPLFARGEAMIPCPRSSALFCFFAQWFTDSFLRTHPTDIRRNTSNHEIDLCQIYGLTRADETLLREHAGGRLLTRKGRDGAYPPLLFDERGERVRKEFAKLGYISPQTGQYLQDILTAPFNTPERKRTLHAAGLERGNSTIVYSALNTIFLREHNRLAGLIARELETDDDDVIFEYARSTNIVQLIRIIIADYINHISGTRFRFNAEIGFAERKHWYRTNRISVEFDLLYRWHPLVPDRFELDGEPLTHERFRFNNALLEEVGLSRVLVSASRQRAGKITLRNTAPFLLAADEAALNKSRAWRLQPFNAYRECFRLPRARSFADLTDDAELAGALERLYGDVERVDLLVGLFAESRGSEAVLGSLMTNMVAADAFTHALTNPLLSANVYGPEAFSPAGLRELELTNRLDDIVQRNVDTAGQAVSFAA